MLKKQLYSFQNAVNGLIWATKTQRNFRIHLTLALLAILGSIIFKVSYLEFLLIFVLIAIGLAIEALNTAIEEAIDAIHKDWSDQIKVAKDASAAAMLIFSVFAFLVACIIFIPKIVAFLTINY